MIKRIASLLFAGLIAASTPAVAADKRTPPPELGTMKGKEAEAFYLGLNAVIWGYPAVKFEAVDARAARSPKSSSSEIRNRR